jgi:phosphonopyruvate decarboxylase
MIKPKDFYDYLKKNEIDFFSGVPDSLLKEFCLYLDINDKKNHVISTNEGSAVGLSIGYNLATNKIPLVYLQNSGLGNIINPLVSLADKKIYSIPMIFLVGWRGEPGEKDEPQHLKQGEITLPILKTMDYEYEVLNIKEDLWKKQLKNLINKASISQSPVFLIVKKDTFEKYETIPYSNKNSLSREKAILTINETVSKNDLIVSTTGKASRELFEINTSNSENDSFLTVGGMGHANQIALGISRFVNNKNVYCIDGDGAALMHLGGLAIIGRLAGKNFCHIIINNESHESVGGQPTLGDELNFSVLSKNFGYKYSKKVKSQKALRNALIQFKNLKGPFFIEVKCSSSSRKNLLRPKNSPLENKVRFRNKIEK